MPDNDELMKKLTEMVGDNTEVMKEVLEKINSLENKVAEQTQKLESVTNQLTEVTEKQEMFTAHLNQIYNSQSIEETLAVMGEMGKSDMDVEQCSIYSYDALENKLFTVSENGEREYTEISASSPVGAALLKNEVFLENQYNGDLLGDDKEEKVTKNVAVIPIESKSGDVIGVVVAKDKTKHFSQTDVDKFDLNKGKIGSAFRIGLENKALKQAAVTDKLTHLYNRQGAEQFLKTAVLPKLRQGEKMSTIMIDIDKFKNFNDTYGHDVGDRVLRQVANILKNNVRDGDGVFRWGGEEMVVIAAMGSADAYALAERLRQTIQDTPLDIDGKSVRITASMGIAGISVENIRDIDKDNIMKFFEERPLKLADERLYQAKKNGRNRVVAPDKVMERFGQPERRKSSVIDNIKEAKSQQPPPKPHSTVKSKNSEIE